MNKEFLFEMLDTMSVSGNEIGLQKKVIKEMTPFADEIRTDYTGNVVCVLTRMQSLRFCWQDTSMRSA